MPQPHPLLQSFFILAVLPTLLQILSGSIGYTSIVQLEITAVHSGSATAVIILLRSKMLIYVSVCLYVSKQTRVCSTGAW